MVILEPVPPREEQLAFEEKKYAVAKEQKKVETGKLREQKRVEAAKLREQKRIEKRRKLSEERRKRREELTLKQSKGRLPLWVKRERRAKEEQERMQKRTEREKLREQKREQRRIEREKLREQEKEQKTLEREKLREQKTLEREKLREQKTLEREKLREQERLERKKLRLERISKSKTKVYISKELFDVIGKKRGKIPRSKFISSVVLNYFESNKSLSVIKKSSERRTYAIEGKINYDLVKMIDEASGTTPVSSFIAIILEQEILQEMKQEA